jgi:putative endonuclease
MRSLFVYIVASHKSGQTFAGITSDLVHRVWQHRSGHIKGMGVPSACAQLVWFDEFSSLEAAEAELDRLSRWPEAWTSRLIEKANPEWADLWTSLKDQPKIGLNPAQQYVSSHRQTTYPVIRPMLQVA